jgi:predicted KAP-like P-loop ATPase
MQLFPPQIAIKDDEGFGKNDIFGRVEDGKRLTNLITTVSQPLVIAVDAAWGHGKTTFLKMWAGELRRLGYPVIYFDAFKNDYVEDAFTALAGEIVALAQQKEKANTPAARRFLETAITAGKILARSGLKVGVKAATVGALEVADFKEVASALSNETEGLADKYVGELITQSKSIRTLWSPFAMRWLSYPHSFQQQVRMPRQSHLL